MITRVRMEARGETTKEVSDKLTEAMALVRSEFGGEWESENHVEFQTTMTGFWAHWTIRRKDANQHSSVS